jgi:hypothetical protein
MDQLEAVIYKFPMSDKTSFALATDEVGSVPVANDVGTPEVSKEPPREFLRVGRKVLNEEELSSPAARRFMIAEIERLDAECTALRGLAAPYNDLRVKCAVLEESQRRSRWYNILSVMCLSAGSAGLGAAPSYLAISDLHGVGWTFAIVSGVLVVAGIASRVFR